MKRRLLLVFTTMIASASLAGTPIQYEVRNASDIDRTDIPVVIPLESSPNDITSAYVSLGDKEIPCQLDDLDQDGVFDELCFLADLKAGASAVYSIQFSTTDEPRQYPSRVYAEMLIRNDKVKEKNKHNNFVSSLTVRVDCANSYNLIHHHGVDFESELNGIRIYFDKRQTLDLYGKFQ